MSIKRFWGIVIFYTACTSLAMEKYSNQLPQCNNSDAQNLHQSLNTHSSGSFFSKSDPLYPTSMIHTYKPFSNKHLTVSDGPICIQNEKILEAFKKFEYQIIQRTSETAPEQSDLVEAKIDIHDLNEAIKKTCENEIKTKHFKEFKKTLPWYQKYIKVTIFGSLCLGIGIKIVFDKFYKWMPHTEQLVNFLTKNNIKQ